jgi:hypothetical protein
MAREEGFEPSVHGTKNRCLTTWLLPKSLKKWGDRRDLNPRVPEPQSGVLTASPRPPQKNGGADGIRTRGLLRDRQAC